jgi:exopolysaccharide biosynthesis polyprenyl glycosylphosphotransferase
VGSGPGAELIARKLCEYPEFGLVPVAARGLELMPADDSGDAGLRRLLSDAAIDHVVLAPEGGQEAAITGCLERLAGIDAAFSILPPMADLLISPALVTQVGGVPLIPLGRLGRERTAMPGKRALDLVVTSGLILALSPLMLATAVAIKLSDGGPILYRQRRVGRGGRTFEMLKFRSMVVGAADQIVDLSDSNAADGLLFKLHDDPRVTRVGRVIRRFAIDELPQLLNVLKGDMSLVGPRPLAVEPDAFRAADNRRHSVLPGITGYWQISGGNGLTFKEMVKLDLAYVQNWSLWLDLRLLLRTLPALAYRRPPW